MAYLHNATRSLRLQWTLADRELHRPGAKRGPERVLARVSVDHLDSKDSEYWPFVRLPSYWLSLDEAKEFVESLERVIRDEVPGFAFRSQIGTELGVQVGKTEAGPYAVELGLDLARYLATYAGTKEADGEALSLFRFLVPLPELVSFASTMRTELSELLEREQPAAR